MTAQRSYRSILINHYAGISARLNPVMPRLIVPPPIIVETIPETIPELTDEECIARIIARVGNKRLLPGVIASLNATAETYGYSVEELTAQNRRRDKTLKPRGIGMTVARLLTGASFPVIGSVFCRDHSTIFHAVRKYQKLVDRVRTALP